MDSATHIPIIRPGGIPDKIPLPCRIERGVRDVKYDYCAYPASLSDKRARGVTRRIENPMVGAGSRQGELITEVYLAFNVF